MNRERGEAHDPLCWKKGWDQPEHDADCFGSLQEARADERERLRAKVKSLMHWSDSGGVEVIEYYAVLALLGGEDS